LLNVYIKDIPAHLLQSDGNISTSRITTFQKIDLKPTSTNFCRNDPVKFFQGNRQYIGDLLNRKDRQTKDLETKKQ